VISLDTGDDMKLVPNAGRILWHAWSVRASLAIALINGFLVGFSVFADIVPAYWFLAVNMIGPIVVVLLRLVDQGLADDE
jgi:polyferredoxin